MLMLPLDTFTKCMFTFDALTKCPSTVSTNVNTTYFPGSREKSGTVPSSKPEGELLCTRALKSRHRVPTCTHFFEKKNIILNLKNSTSHSCQFYIFISIINDKAWGTAMLRKEWANKHSSAILEQTFLSDGSLSKMWAKRLGLSG